MSEEASFLDSRPETAICHNICSDDAGARPSIRAERGDSMSPLESYLRETTPTERSALLRELNVAIVTYLEFNIPVYLDGLGIVIPKISTQEKSHCWHDKLVVRSETLRSVNFEKCYELTTFHREQYPGVIESRELAKRIYPRLPLPMSVEWGEKKARRAIKGLIAAIKEEIVLTGSSGQLGTIGDFFALHNRQGDNPKDWYAGSDIFLDPFYEDVLDLGPSRIGEVPVFPDAWEPLSAMLGEPIATFTVNIRDELFKLGYEAPALIDRTEHGRDQIRLAVYVSDGREPGEGSSLVYCTDGLRETAYKHGHSTGCEIVFQLPVSSSEVEKLRAAEMEVPRWAARPICMGWLLLSTSSAKQLTIGSGLSCGHPICDSAHTELNTVFVTHFGRLSAVQQTETGAFTYQNVIGITDDEARVAKLYSPEHLITLLRYKKLDQLTKRKRSSIVARTNLLSDKDQSQAWPGRPWELSGGAQTDQLAERLIPRGKIVSVRRAGLPPAGCSNDFQQASAGG